MSLKPGKQKVKRALLVAGCGIGMVVLSLATLARLTRDTKVMSGEVAAESVDGFHPDESPAEIAEEAPVPVFTATPTPPQAAVEMTPPGVLPTKATPLPNVNEVATPPPVAVSIRDMAPKLSDIRKQIEEDPHGTPKTLMDFSVAVGRRIRAVAVTDEGTEKVFAELEDCVLHPLEEKALSLQSICLFNAHALAAQHSSLASRFGSLESRANAEVVRRAQAVY